jgi:group I intron endonuclease
MPINELDSGIYKITTLHNNKFYIGSSVFLRGRKYDHFSRLKANKHANQHLQRIYNKYGRQNFKFEYLTNCPKEDLIELFFEDYWLEDGENFEDLFDKLPKEELRELYKYLRGHEKLLNKSLKEQYQINTLKNRAGLR